MFFIWWRASQSKCQRWSRCHEVGSSSLRRPVLQPAVDDDVQRPREKRRHRRRLPHDVQRTPSLGERDDVENVVVRERRPTQDRRPEVSRRLRQEERPLQTHLGHRSGLPPFCNTACHFSSIAQWIKHSPVTQAARVKTQTWSKIISNLKKYIVLIFSWVPPPCALSLSPNGWEKPWKQVTCYRWDKSEELL